MRTLENLDHFVLPETLLAAPLPPPLALQLNLFSGALYLRDYAAYKDLCILLRLHFGDLPPHLAKPSIINPWCYVRDPAARRTLGMFGPGFSDYPLPFLRRLLILRRYGLDFGPSHMGKLLYGTKLHNKDFEF